MSPSPMGSFTRFFFGLMLFIFLSFGLTFAVQTILASQEAQEQQAAAAAAMLGQKN